MLLPLVDLGNHDVRDVPFARIKRLQLFIPGRRDNRSEDPEVLHNRFTGITESLRPVPLSLHLHASY